MLNRSGNIGVICGYALLSLRLKDFFQKLCQRGLVFRAARIELQRETDLRGLVHDLSPEIDRLLRRELNFEPDELLHFNLTAREHEAAAATEIGDGGILAREHAFPASR